MITKDIIRVTDSGTSTYGPDYHFCEIAIVSSVDKDGSFGVHADYIPDGSGRMSRQHPTNGWRYFESPEEAALMILKHSDPLGPYGD